MLLIFAGMNFNQSVIRDIEVNIKFAFQGRVARLLGIWFTSLYY